MRALLLLCGLTLSVAPLASAAPRRAPAKSSVVVAPAPDFAFAAPGRAHSLRALRGQAVVLVIADHANTRAFRKQLKELASIYQEFASRSVVFVAALKAGEGPVRSNIPFVLALNGADVAARYNVNGKFQIAVISPDGNIDYQTDQVLPGGRVRDVIQNTFVIQSESRKN